VRDIMGLLTRYKVTAAALRDMAESASKALANHPDAMAFRHNVEVYGAQLDALDPPAPDFPD
jgi:hypothetical protein